MTSTQTTAKRPIEDESTWRKFHAQNCGMYPRRKAKIWIGGDDNIKQNILDMGRGRAGANERTATLRINQHDKTLPSLHNAAVGR